MNKFKKYLLLVFFGLNFLSLLTPFWVFGQLQFPYITGKAFFFRIAMELALPCYLILLLTDRKLRPRLSLPLNLAVIVFLLVNFTSAFLGVNVARSLWGNFERMGGAYYLAHLVLLYFYVQLLGQAGGWYLKRFLQSFIGVALLVTLNGVSGWLHGPILIQDPSLPDRASSTFGNPIFFASFLVVPMFLAAYFALSEENKNWRIFYWLAAAFQLLGIYISGTRGAVVGLLVGLFVAALAYSALTKNSKIRRRGLGLIAVFVVMFGGLFAFHSKLPAGSTLYRIVNLKDSNTEARLIQWKIALKGFKDRPMLGVGPENYYVIFDKYFNPELYKYDPSWFDKPHNFLIEVLVTNGVLGFIAYIAMFVFSLCILWKAFKSDVLSLAEACLLAGGMITYQVQNLFVFDTVSASVAFYAFLGLLSYILSETGEEKTVEEKSRLFSVNLLLGLLGAGILASAYLVYLTNIQSIEAAKRTNFGYAYTSYDPKIAAQYFESALSVSFNLDPRETVNRYSDYAATLVNMSDWLNKQPDFVASQVDNALAEQKKITYQTKNDPLLWMRLCIDELNYAILHKTDIAPVQDAINKTIALSPKRAEILQLQMQLDGYQKNWQDTLKVALKIVELNPYNPGPRWQLAMAYYLNGNKQEAVAAGDEALNMGFKFSQLQQFAWYIQYYEDKNDNAKVAPLLERAIELEPNEIGLYFDLAKVYANLGNYEKARVLAQQVAKSDPSRKSAVDKFLSEIANK